MVLDGMFALAARQIIQIFRGAIICSFKLASGPLLHRLCNILPSRFHPMGYEVRWQGNGIFNFIF